jgi:hypothetical protein
MIAYPYIVSGGQLIRSHERRVIAICAQKIQQDAVFIFGDAVVLALLRWIDGMEGRFVCVGKPHVLKTLIGDRAEHSALCVGFVLAGIDDGIGGNYGQKIDEWSGGVGLVESFR